MKHLPPPLILLRELQQNPHAITVVLLVISVFSLGLGAWFIVRNLRLNEPGLRAPLAFTLALIAGGFGLAGSVRFPAPLSLGIGAIVIGCSALLFGFADHRRYVRDPLGAIVADRWKIVLRFAGFSWIRDKANRHFFFSGDTGSGKTSGLNSLLADLIKRDPNVGGVVMANKGDEYFYLQWLAKKYGREKDLIHLRPRLMNEDAPPPHRLNVTGDIRLPFTTRARILVDTAAALNPKDEKGFFKVKGATHIANALEALNFAGKPVTATQAYNLLTSKTERELMVLDIEKLPSTVRRNKLLVALKETYDEAFEAGEQRAGELGTAQNYLEYLVTPEIAEVFCADQPDTCTIADVDRGRILCVDVPQDFTVERQYIFTVMKLLLYRHALRRYAMPPWLKHAQNQLVFVGDEFQNAITASHDGTSDFNVVDRLRDCLLMLIISAQAFESLVPPQTKEQAEVLALNLKNLVMYRAASEQDALRCANAIGKHWVEKATRTVHADHTSRTYQSTEEFRIKPHAFRSLPDHTAIIRHCTNGHRKATLRPV